MLHRRGRVGPVARVLHHAPLRRVVGRVPDVDSVVRREPRVRHALGVAARRGVVVRGAVRGHHALPHVPVDPAHAGVHGRPRHGRAIVLVLVRVLRAHASVPHIGVGRHVGVGEVRAHALRHRVAHGLGLDLGGGAVAVGLVHGEVLQFRNGGGRGARPGWGSHGEETGEKHSLAVALAALVALTAASRPRSYHFGFVSLLCLYHLKNNSLD